MMVTAIRAWVERLLGHSSAQADGDEPDRYVGYVAWAQRQGTKQAPRQDQTGPQIWGDYSKVA